MTDPIVIAKVEQPLVDLHELKQFETGSQEDDETRRKRHDCRYCPRSIQDPTGRIRRKNRRTTYYRFLCQVCFHPQCFNKYHNENSLNFVAPR